MAIKLRDARVGDAPLLAAAEAETARTPGLLISRPSEFRPEAFAGKIGQLATRGRYLVAERDGNPVGHALLEPMPLAARQHVFQLTIVVHPGHTGRGIGRLLMQALLDWAEQDTRVGKIELRVRSSNRVAIGLYRHFGFMEEGRFRAQLRLPDGTMLDDIAMAWFPRRHRPAPLILEAERVRLEPLSPDHLDGLCAVGLDPDLWQWVPVRVHDRAGMRTYVEKALDEQHRGVSLPFATILKQSGQVVGSTRYLNMDSANRRVEIGCTWIARDWQRTAVNTEAKYLMLGHAFEVLGCARVELKTDAHNARSRAAIQRLGARQEGILRRHVLMDTGRMRDTVYFSILADEWPAVKTALAASLNRNATEPLPT